MRRRVAYVSGKRGGFGALLPALRAIAAHPELELVTVVTDMHLYEAFGSTVTEVEKGVEVGWRVDMATTVIVGAGVLLILLGNLLPLARSNFIFGIRTPWTLSSETVWTQSHRVGGYAMVGAGLVTIVSAFIARPAGLIVAIASLMLSGLIPIVYSYVAWSRERGGPSTGTP